MTYLTQDKLPQVEKINEIAKFYAAKKETDSEMYPDGFEELYEEYYDKNPVCFSAIGLSIRYLEDMMLADVTIPFSSFR